MAAYCLKCDYPLAGVPSPCPECGRTFDPANPATTSPEPTARRRRWQRGLRTTLLVVLVIQILVPRQFTRISFAWTNPDGKTITTHTRWSFLRPAWLPIRYPSWSREETAPLPTGQFTVLNQANWRIGFTWIDGDGGYSVAVPATPTSMGCATFWVDAQPTGRQEHVIIGPGSIDELWNRLVFKRETGLAIVYSTAPPSAAASGP